MAFIDIQDPVKREEIVRDYVKKHKGNPRKKKKIRNFMV